MPGPVVGAAAVLSRHPSARFVAELAGMRNGVEGPAQLAGTDVVGADVAGRRRQALADPAADDQQVLVDDAGMVSRTDCVARIAAEVLRRSMRPSLPNAAMGLPVRASSA